MSEEKDYPIDANTIFILAQKIDILKKTGIFDALKETENVKISIVKLEKDMNQVQLDIQEIKSTRKDKIWKILMVIITPLVALLLAIMGHWVDTRNQIHCIESKVKVLESIIYEKDKEYDYKFLKRSEYFKSGEKDADHPYSRR